MSSGWSGTATIYVERGDEELELEVRGSVSAYVPAVTHRAPEDCHPAEGGDIEIESVTLDGKPFELTKDEQSRAEEALAEKARDWYEDYDPPERDEEDRYDDEPSW